MSRLGLLLVIVSFGTGTGCASLDPIDASSAIAGRPGPHETGHPPWGSIAITRVADRRANYEHGTSYHYGDTYASNALFDRPIPATIMRVLVREIHRSGLFVFSEGADSSKYLLDIEIRHFCASWNVGAFDIVPLLAGTAVRSRLQINMVLTDQDGRRFIDRSFEHETDRGVGASAESAAGDQLTELLGRFADDFLSAADRAIPQFWARHGLPVR